jgi:hypothetical protein
MLAIIIEENYTQEKKKLGPRKKKKWWGSTPQKILRKPFSVLNPQEISMRM